MGSSIPALKRALSARLQADPGLQGPNTQVSHGDPYPEPEALELVAIGAATRIPLDLTGGATRGTEEYSVAVLVSVVGSKQLPHADLEARAYELADTVTSSVLAWRQTSFDGLALDIVPGESEDGAFIADNRGSEIRLSFDVTAMASYEPAD